MSTTASAADIRRQFQWNSLPGEKKLFRQLTGFEDRLYPTVLPSAHGYCEFYMVHSALLKLERQYEVSRLTYLVSQAWRSLYTLIPNLSTLVELSDGGEPVFTYLQEAGGSVSEDEWLIASYKEHLTSLSDYSVPRLLESVSAGVCQSICTFNTISHGFLDATFLEDSTSDSPNTSTVVLTLRTSHLCFDGIGAWSVMHALLQALAEGSQGAPHKRLPELPLIAHFADDVLEGDHSALSQSQIKEMEFADGHLFGPVSSDMCDTSPAMGMAKCRLAKEVTASILLRCRQLRVTISQLFQACFIVSLLGEFPASRSSQIYYDFPINLRPLTSLPEPFFGNAIDVSFNTLPCAPLTQNLLQGNIKSTEDAKAAYSLTQQLTTKVALRRSQAVRETYSLMTIFKEGSRGKAKAEQAKGLVTARVPPLVCAADGLLDRHISATYTGSSLAFRVDDADVLLRRTSSLISSRIYTFDGRLTFLLTFTPGVWTQAKVNEILATSLDNLEIITRLMVI